MVDKKGKIKIKGESRKVSLEADIPLGTRSWSQVGPRFLLTRVFIQPIRSATIRHFSSPFHPFVFRGRNRIPRSRARDRTRVARPALRRIRPQVFQELRHYISTQGRRKGKGDSSGGRGKWGISADSVNTVEESTFDPIQLFSVPPVLERERERKERFSFFEGKEKSITGSREGKFLVRAKIPIPLVARRRTNENPYPS